MKKTYNKLVRDKIPEIISAKQNQKCMVKILDDNDYLQELNKKLKEETNEYLESGDVEELADIEEVLKAILEAKKVSFDEFEKIRTAKVQKRGAFKNKIFLESVEED